MIDIYRVRSDNRNLIKKSHNKDNAYLSGKAQADELVLHNIIVPDGTEISGTVAVHYYRKAN